MVLLLTEGQTNDHKGALLLLPVLPPAKELLAYRGYDSDRLRSQLADLGIEPCIPPCRNRKVQLAYARDLYRQRHRIENAFGRFKDWRRIAMRYDRCAHTFFSAIRIAATVTFWLCYRVLTLVTLAFRIVWGPGCLRPSPMPATYKKPSPAWSSNSRASRTYPARTCIDL